MTLPWVPKSAGEVSQCEADSKTRRKEQEEQRGNTEANLTLAGHEHVGALEVAMDDTLLVKIVQRLKSRENLKGNYPRRRRRKESVPCT